ncbi:MAG: hypothetical protein ACKESB_01185 [Candidatus Hodgkinia cicadicola]
MATNVMIEYLWTIGKQKLPLGLHAEHPTEYPNVMLTDASVVANVGNTSEWSSGNGALWVGCGVFRVRKWGI